MAAVKTASALLLLALASGGSTCKGQSTTTDTATKDPQSAAVAEVTLPGVDSSSLTPRERKEYSAYVTEFLAPCAEIPVSVAQCVTEKRACPRCMPAAKFVLKGVRDGMSREQIEAAYKNRFAADTVKNVAVDGSPSKGPEAAPVTLVEFADFECAHCGAFAPVL